MREFFASSIVFRLWLALSVVATIVMTVVLTVYVWLAVGDDIRHAQQATRGNVEALIANATRLGVNLVEPDPALTTTANELGVTRVEVLDAAGKTVSTFDFSGATFDTPPLSAAFLQLAERGAVARTLRFQDGRAAVAAVSPLGVIRGQAFGEERIVPLSALFFKEPGYLRVLTLYPDLTSQAHDLIQKALLAAAVSIIAILLAMWPCLQYFVSGSLRRYSQLAMRIAVGDSVRMPAEGAGELGELGRAVNSMADALEHQATVDALTGLFNLRHLSSHLEALISEAFAKNWPLSVIFCDLDGLKIVNDTYGHLAGDRVLRAVSNAIRNWSDRGFTCWRLGGDEFVIALPNISEEEGLVLAANLRKVIGNLAVPVTDTLIRPSISVGLATYPTDGASAGALLGIADRHMYTAKASRPDEGGLMGAPAA